MYFKLNKFEIKVGRKIVTFFPDSIGYCSVCLEGFWLVRNVIFKSNICFLNDFGCSGVSRDCKSSKHFRHS